MFTRKRNGKEHIFYHFGAAFSNIYKVEKDGKVYINLDFVKTGAKLETKTFY